ncbi:hypothetical protein EV1_002160 [Malus domestica]
MGGGGQVDPTASNNASTALFTTFAIFSILGGGIYNIFGPHLTLPSACSTYVLYAGSFLYYNHHNHQAFAIVAGAILGIGAGILWAGQGSIMTSYPPPNRKGTYISIFWSIFNMGGRSGFRQRCNLHWDNDFHVHRDSLSLAILPPSKIVRDDRTKCTDIQYSNVTTEAIEIAKLFTNWKMLLIIPAAWSSIFFYTYLFNNVNKVMFNLRTRGLNNVFYWGAEIFGFLGIGYVMDFSSKSRRTRGFVGISVVGVLGTAIWIGGLANQLNYFRSDLPEKLDFKDSGSAFAGPFVLYFSFGLLDAMFQSMVFWVIGALADNSEILSRYAGFYKGIQSAGAAVAWQIDTCKASFLSQLVTNFALYTVSYPLLVVLILLAMKDECEADVEEFTKRKVAELADEISHKPSEYLS